MDTMTSKKDAEHVEREFQQELFEVEDGDEKQNVRPSLDDMPPLAGDYPVETATIVIPGGKNCGYKCANRRRRKEVQEKEYGDTVIFYPTTGDGPFPIASFGHGMGGQIYDHMLRSVASLGFVIVAPQTDSTPYDGIGCDYNHDYLYVTEILKDHTDLHAALGKVDWGRRALIGHSQGSTAQFENAAKAEKYPELNIKAAWFSKSFVREKASKLTIPIFLSSESGAKNQEGRDSIALSPAVYKVYFWCKDCKHAEPAHYGRETTAAAHFLGCHVADLSASCAHIYGSEADVCTSVPMHTCVVTGPGSEDTPGQTEGAITLPPSPAPTQSPTPQCQWTTREEKGKFEQPTCLNYAFQPTCSVPNAGKVYYANRFDCGGGDAADLGADCRVGWQRDARRRKRSYTTVYSCECLNA